MAERPFRVRRRQGLLHLTLDTPGSSVNIFDGAAAEQILHELQDLRGVRAVLVDSAKQDSFCNGARLLALCSIRTPADAVRLSRPVRAAYEAIRRAPVPTVAAVKGNCYGCGLEMLLHFDHRVAADTFDTRFYLTEVHDYLVLPAYGAMSILPGLVGLEGAEELLLQGRRWGAREAERRGLVDRVIPTEDFPGGVRAFLDEVLAGRAAPRRTPPPADLAAARERLERLPPRYLPLYAEGLEVMSQAAAGADVEHQERRAFSRSAAKPRVKAAVRAFMLRQMAEGIALGADPPPLQIRLEGEGLPDLKLDHVGEGLRVVVPPVVRGLDADPEPPVLFLPHGDRFFELALDRAPAREDRALYRYLLRAGFAGVITRPRRGTVSRRWLDAFRAPAEELRRFGFRNPPPTAGDRPLPSVLLSLLALVLEQLEERALPHPAVADLIARELLDFPLHLGSLCSHMTPERARAMRRGRKDPRLDSYTRGFYR